MAVRPVLVSIAVLALWAPSAQALPGPSGERDASVAQYGYSATETPPVPQVLTPPPPGGEVLGETLSNEETASGASPERRETASGGSPAVVREQAAGGSSPSLPFTGANALYGVLAGCLLIAFGATLRRVVRTTPA